MLCVVAVDSVRDNLSDGMLVRVDGSTGSVAILEDVNDE